MNSEWSSSRNVFTEFACSVHQARERDVTLEPDFKDSFHQHFHSVLSSLILWRRVKCFEVPGKCSSTKYRLLLDHWFLFRNLLMSAFFGGHFHITWLLMNLFTFRRDDFTTPGFKAGFLCRCKRCTSAYGEDATWSKNKLVRVRWTFIKRRGHRASYEGPGSLDLFWSRGLDWNGSNEHRTG